MPYGLLHTFESDQSMTDFRRLYTHLLKNRAGQARRQPFSKPWTSIRPARRARLISPPAQRELEREVSALPPSQRLYAQGDMAVYIAQADQIPTVLLDIGRLREQTFREVGEGTGKACDLDRFDSSYLHLFIWEHNAREIVGAYRVGICDDIMRRAGRTGLYVNTLFRCDNSFFKSLGPALELGRSFISSQYQKKYNSLAALWYGLGRFVARHPQYTTLYGPVSISNAYQAVSRDLMIQFLTSSRADRALARFVRPRHPARCRHIQGVGTCGLDSPGLTLDHVSMLISEIEQDRKGIPVLLRHYLKLNGTIVSFNVDKKFSRVVDSLLVVDLRKTDRRLLKRFLGSAGYESFVSYHSQKADYQQPSIQGVLQ